MFFFFFTSSNEAVCTCLQHKYWMNVPHAHEKILVEQLVVIEKPRNNLISVPKNKQWKKFAEYVLKSTKWSTAGVCSEITGTTKARREPQLPLKMPACRYSKSHRLVPFPPISSLPACLMGQSLQLTRWQ